MYLPYLFATYSVIRESGNTIRIDTRCVGNELVWLIDHALVSPPVPYADRECLATEKLQNPLGRNVASQFMEDNSDILGGINSLAKALIAVPKFIVGTLPLKLSKAIQGGHDAASDSFEGKSRYLLSFPPWLVGTLGP
jgi:hypothetical protein